jgi:PAS domain S-box-containing protein
VLSEDNNLNSDPREQSGTGTNSCAGMMRALMLSIPDLVYFKDAKGRFVSVSNTCALYANASINDIVGKTDFDFLPRDQAEELSIEDGKIMQTGEAVKDKIERRKCPSGKEIWVSVTKAPWKNEDGDVVGIIGVCRDVTERFENERHILDMISIATHDIRGPLISLGSTIKLLIRGTFGFIDESVKVTLTDLSSRIQNLEKIVSEYLCKSSLMNVKMPEKEYLDLRQDIIDPILSEFFSEIEENDIKIDNRLGAIPGNRIIIRANANWIRIVYRNLLRNAIRYAVSGHIAFGFEEMEKHYRLNVYNSGPPVPEEKREKIFEMFESKSGTGLGLAISRSLILKHGGDMWYETTENNHPNFIFTIPK